MPKAISIAKFEDNSVCEDSSISKDTYIAVSDGAGGGGVYADRWSKYLVTNLSETPIKSFEELDSWIESIWETFYNESEKAAIKNGGLFLDKFYNEGSFATIAVAWNYENSIHWMAYGDSVVFCYHPESKTLEHSFTQLKDFSKPPYLINCKDECSQKGFNAGVFSKNKNDIVFICSDSLAHYFIMMYNIVNYGRYENDIEEALNTENKNSDFIKSALHLKVDFYMDILKPVIDNIDKENELKGLLLELRKNNLIANDDYSIAVL